MILTTNQIKSLNSSGIMVVEELPVILQIFPKNFLKKDFSHLS